MPLRRMVIKVMGKRMIGVVKNFQTEAGYQEYKRDLHRQSKYGEYYKLIYKSISG